MTLYADGQDFNQDSQLATQLLTLLEKGIYVAIVTAAAYANEPLKYEKRLKGLLEAFKSSSIPPANLEKFHVLGGECNYLFQYDSKKQGLSYIEPDTIQSEARASWVKDTPAIKALLDVAEENLLERVQEM